MTTKVETAAVEAASEVETEDEGREFTDEETAVAEQVAKFIIQCVTTEKGQNIDPFAVIEMVRLVFEEMYQQYAESHPEEAEK